MLAADALARNDSTKWGKLMYLQSLRTQRTLVAKPRFPTGGIYGPDREAKEWQWEQIRVHREFWSKQNGTPPTWPPVYPAQLEADNQTLFFGRVDI